MFAIYKKSACALFLVNLLLLLATHTYAQSGNSTTVNGTVLDPSGAVVPNATVEIHNPVSQLDRSATTDTTGKFSIPNIPFNPYHLSVSASGFAPHSQDIDVRSSVPLT